MIIDRPRLVAACNAVERLAARLGPMLDGPTHAALLDAEHVLREARILVDGIRECRKAGAPVTLGGESLDPSAVRQRCEQYAQRFEMVLDINRP